MCCFSINFFLLQFRCLRVGLFKKKSHLWTRNFGKPQRSWLNMEDRHKKRGNEKRAKSMQKPAKKGSDMRRWPRIGRWERRAERRHKRRRRIASTGARSVTEWVRESTCPFLDRAKKGERRWRKEGDENESQENVCDLWKCELARVIVKQSRNFRKISSWGLRRSVGIHRKYIYFRKYNCIIVRVMISLQNIDDKLTNCVLVSTIFFERPFVKKAWKWISLDNYIAK